MHRLNTCSHRLTNLANLDRLKDRRAVAVKAMSFLRHKQTIQSTPNRFELVVGDAQYTQASAILHDFEDITGQL
jgi:hypothetical protein